MGSGRGNRWERFVKQYEILSMTHSSVLVMGGGLVKQDVLSICSHSVMSWYALLFLKKIYLLIYYLFLAALGLCCCARAFSSCGKKGLLFIVVHRLLTAVASLVAEHAL